eukprot:2532044-Alexandrium_andersonii.AAC.1
MRGEAQRGLGCQAAHWCAGVRSSEGGRDRAVADSPRRNASKKKKKRCSGCKAWFGKSGSGPSEPAKTKGPQTSTAQERTRKRATPAPKGRALVHALKPVNAHAATCAFREKRLQIGARGGHRACGGAPGRTLPLVLSVRSGFK